MASTQASKKIFANQVIQMWDHDPAVNTAVIVSPDGGTTIRTVDMRDCNQFAVIAMTTILGGAGINLLEIIASETVNMASAVVVKTSGAVVADAMGDYVVEECTAAEVGALGTANSKDLRFVAGRITTDNAGDEAVVTYVQNRVRFAQDGLTVDTIA